MYISKYNLVKNLGFGHNKATHTKSYFKYYIETANFRLGILQDSKYEFKFPIKSLKYDRKFYNRVILKNTIYNKVIYYFIKFFEFKIDYCFLHPVSKESLYQAFLRDLFLLHS